MIKIYLTKKIAGQELPVSDFKIGLNLGQRGRDGEVPEGIVIDHDYVHTDNNYDDSAVAEVAKIAGKQDKTDNLLVTDDKTVVGAINEVNSIAKGANQALAFDNYQAVIAAMLISGLNEGQNLYVDTLDVPDLWVKSVEISFVEYDYVSDEQFITDVLAGFQIGYYILALLETQKVDLIDYYTKTETDQAIEDYAEPLRTTDQNYVSDAELEVLQNTSGTNTGDETQDTIGDLIELTELATVTDTTKIAASDSAFLKWFSGLTIYTYLKGKFDLVYASIANYFSKTESDRRFVNQNGGTIYHTTRWFTPTSALTIAANGLSATITSGQFTSGMTGAKLKLTGGVNEPIITYVSTNQINLSFAVDASFFGQSVAIADWGVYGRATFIGSYLGETSFHYFLSDGRSFARFNDGLFNSMSIIGSLSKGPGAIVWGSSVYAQDLGLTRNAAGIFEINNGTAGTFRDLKLRTIFADKIILNALNTAPSSATDTGTLGEVRITSDYIYVCTATNTWKRILIETW